MFSSTLSLPQQPPRPGDVTNLMLQVAEDGSVHISIVAFSKLIPAPPSPSVAAADTTPSAVSTSAPLSLLPVPHPRVRLLGHTRSETKDGTPFIVYIVEYVASPSAKPAVTSVRFSDAYGLHRTAVAALRLPAPVPSPDSAAQSER